MKLKASHINTFCLWWSRTAGFHLDFSHFLAHAMKWKFGQVDEKRLLFICHAFKKSRYVPDFAQEYWHKMVLPLISLNGGVR